jgi:hypothetical protein
MCRSEISRVLWSSRQVSDAARVDSGAISKVLGWACPEVAVPSTV